MSYRARRGPDNAGQGDLWNTTSITGGLHVNGIALPNTPVEIPAV